jgi:hypothetical protein
MNARLYDPTIGRFISADRFVQDIGNSQTYNRYSYCANNPVNTFDPTGNNFWDWLGGLWNWLFDSSDEAAAQQKTDTTFSNGSPVGAGVADASSQNGSIANPSATQGIAGGTSPTVTSVVDVAYNNGSTARYYFGPNGINPPDDLFSGATSLMIYAAMWAQPTSENAQITRGSDKLRAAALSYYGKLPIDIKKKITDTFLAPDSVIYAIKTTPDGKVVSEYQFSIGRYEKRDGTVYYLSTDVAHSENPADASMITVMGASPDWKISLKNIIDIHSHPDSASPGLSFVDRSGYSSGAKYFVYNKLIFIPREYSGAFYGKGQVFYGWSSEGEYYLTFEEMRNVLK